MSVNGPWLRGKGGGISCCGRANPGWTQYKLAPSMQYQYHGRAVGSRPLSVCHHITISLSFYCFMELPAPKTSVNLDIHILLLLLFFFFLFFFLFSPLFFFIFFFLSFLVSFCLFCFLFCLFVCLFVCMFCLFH